MSLDDLDPVLTGPKRLACLGGIAAAKEVAFGFLSEQLNLSDSDLSKQLKALTDAGYIESNKTGRGAGRRTWLTVTDEGRAALASHVAALQALVSPQGWD